MATRKPSYGVHKFLKTRLCPTLNDEARRKCSKANCTYAHSLEDLKPAVSLDKTQMCRGKSPCITKGCKYAHNKFEIRSTKDFFKNRPCLTKPCIQPDLCRKSHCPLELPFFNYALANDIIKVTDSCVLHADFESLFQPFIKEVKELVSDALKCLGTTVTDSVYEETLLEIGNDALKCLEEHGSFPIKDVDISPARVYSFETPEPLDLHCPSSLTFDGMSDWEEYGVLSDTEMPAIPRCQSYDGNGRIFQSWTPTDTDPPPRRSSYEGTFSSYEGTSIGSFASPPPQDNIYSLEESIESIIHMGIHSHNQ